jgi:prephenate dehydratase
MTQKPLIIAIQGDMASFHDLAVREYFKKILVRLHPCKTFKQVCLAIDSREADYGVIAIENSLAGSLLPNYVLLENHPIQIIGEQYLHISHNLMALPGQLLEDIRVVRSHPMALAQSSEFFERHPHLEPLETNDTAESAREIAKNRMSGVGAVASQLAAELFELEILEAGIENLKKNYTRFFILASREEDFQLNGQKASLNFRITHQIGSLVGILDIFKKYQINLTLIQSVPIPGNPDEYSFHIDLEWAHRDNFNDAMREVIKNVQEVYLLGIYEKGIKPY